MNKDLDTKQKEFNKRQEEFDDRLKELEQKQNYKNKRSKLLFPTFTKNLVALIIFVCVIDLQLTYVLAFFNKTSIAEQLSQSLCQTILGVAFIYIIRAYFDSKAENGANDLKTNVQEIINGTVEKVESVINKKDDTDVPIDGNEFDYTDEFEDPGDKMNM